MYEIQETTLFSSWLSKLKDRRAKAKIFIRLDRACEGNFGDFHAVGSGVSEFRINEGKGYRVYYTIRDKRVVFLLCGGDKSSQNKDINLAIKLKGEL